MRWCWRRIIAPCLVFYFRILLSTVILASYLFLFCRTLSGRIVLRRKCLTVDTPSGGAGAGRGLTLEEEKAFKDAFPAVMVDTALGFNIFGRLIFAFFLLFCCCGYAF